VSEFFLGVILVPVIGNIAEHLVAVTVALKNQMSLGVEIAVGSSLQVAMFVVPFLVFASLMMGNPLSLVFNGFEVIALIGAVLITAFVAGDGESNWLEGAELVALYLITALAFFFLP
jgi:Ca2+:H+ antiporter